MIAGPVARANRVNNSPPFVLLTSARTTTECREQEIPRISYRKWRVCHVIKKARMRFLEKHKFSRDVTSKKNIMIQIIFITYLL